VTYWSDFHENPACGLVSDTSLRWMDGWSLHLRRSFNLQRTPKNEQ